MSTGLLDFFVLEGSECVEQLDVLLARAASGAPDLDAFARNARALRGSATMAKIPGITDVANALERVIKGLRAGSVQWTPQLRGAIIAAVDDLKILIRGVRAWGPAEDARAAARTTELNSLAPAVARPAAPAAAGSAAFLAIQTADVAAGLQNFADNPGAPATFADTLARIRALRGVAALLDLPPLAEVVAAVDDAAKGLEIGSKKATDALRELFRAAAVVLREGSDAIQAGGRPDAGTDAVFQFTIAAQGLIEGTGDDDQVVPIHTLFPDGAGDNVIHAEPNPPTTPAQRFKLEVVSQAEHLRRLVGDARRAADAPTRQRLGHELRAAVKALARSAASFGETVVAGSLGTLVEGAAALDSLALTGLDEAAALLASRVDEPLAPKIADIVRRATPMRSSTPISPIPAVATPVAAKTPPRAATPIATPAVAAATPLAAAPSGGALHDMLGAGISGLASLGETPLSAPTELEDDGVVPIQDLLYRGRAALRRAAQLGQSFRTSGSTPNADELAELYDLLELAEAD
ncbi:MAG TPA: Hpt domain-containing protein [Gemmatimonadaceae bacterium]|nr:Hpt domain-containing protein [Gemmatimonadaceae bacterium]